jgi:hemerythrin-like domain-containing protein
MTPNAQTPGASAHVSLKQVHAFQQAVEDHRFLSEYLANVQRSAALFKEPEAHERLSAMRAFLAEHVIGHFGFEERHVFPHLLESAPDPAIRQAVLELIDEHRAMRTGVRKLRRGMRHVHASGDAPSLARLEESFREFLVVLQAHAVKEDNILLAFKQSRRQAIRLQ